MIIFQSFEETSGKTIPNKNLNKFTQIYCFISDQTSLKMI